MEENLSQERKHKNKRNFLIPIACAAVITSASSLFLGNYMATKGIFLVRTSDAVKNTASQVNDIDKYSALFTVRDTLIEKFDGDIDDNALLEGAIKGMTSALDDPYTVFMNSDEFEKLMNQSNGSMSGIGVTVTSKDNNIVILSTLKDSPAQKAGIQENDIITKIDDIDYTGDQLNEAIKVIGEGSGKSLKFTIKRGEEYLDLDIIPEEFKINVVEGEMIDPSVGYIRIKSFMNENVTEDFKSEIKRLQEQGMKGLILDLRENGGGLLSEAVGVASQFIPKGKIITYTIDKYDNRNESLSIGGIAEGMNLVVLVNGNSASASEVVTGALRDYNAGIVVGDTTFGKGIVQQTMKFKNGIGGLKVTISKYYTPNGENIHKKGITPEFQISNETGIDESGYDKSNDKQLELAIEKIKEKNEAGVK